MPPPGAAVNTIVALGVLINLSRRVTVAREAISFG